MVGFDGDRREVLPFDTVRRSFSDMVAAPNSLAVDGRIVPGFPDRVVPLDEVRDRLLDRRCAAGTRAAVWQHAIEHAHGGRTEWTIGCAGLALPGLVGSYRRLASWFDGEAADLQSAILLGFLAELADIDPAAPAVGERLRWAAYRSGYDAVAEALDRPEPVDTAAEADTAEPLSAQFRAQIPKPPWGHPDIVLARAVGDGVITAAEADLIGATRLDKLTLTGWARLHNVRENTAYAARRRAERRLVAHLTDSADPETSPPVTAQHDGATHDRQVSPTPSVHNFGSKSGLLSRRGLAHAPRSTSPRPDSEDRRCG